MGMPRLDSEQRIPPNLGTRANTHVGKSKPCAMAPRRSPNTTTRPQPRASSVSDAIVTAFAPIPPLFLRTARNRTVPPQTAGPRRESRRAPFPQPPWTAPRRSPVVAGTQYRGCYSVRDGKACTQRGKANDPAALTSVSARTDAVRGCLRNNAICQRGAQGKRVRGGC